MGQVLTGGADGEPFEEPLRGVDGRPGAAWNHAEDGLWPYPEDPEADLNEVAGPEWIDDAGRRARDRLRDWDSMIADSEAVLVGFAAALHSTVSADELETLKHQGDRVSR